MDTTALIYKVLCAHNGYFEMEEMRANISTTEDDLESVLGNQDMFTSAVFEGNKLIVAKTKMRLCRDKECNGCSNLHLCVFYLYGTCRFNEGCRFSHELTSEYNIRVLREHHLEEFDKRELCTLLLQNDNTLLPQVCFTYNKGSGEYGYCPDKESCRRLHVCERYIRGTCAAEVDCDRSHDFYEPHPLNTLQQRGVPNELVASMLSTYRNIQAIQYEEGSRPVCHPPPPPPPPQTYLPAPNVVQRETHYIHLQPITTVMLCNFKLKSRPFVQTKPKSHTKPSSSASHQSKPYKPPTPAPHKSKSSQPTPHQSKSTKPDSPAPQQSKSSKPPPLAPHQSKSSKPPPPAPHQSKSSKPPPPTPQQSKSSKPPPPAPHQSKSSKPPPPTPQQSKSSKPPPPAPHQSKSSKPPPPAPQKSKSSKPASHQPKTTKAPPSARRR
ncbi:extensin [Salmo salar]|uniref:Extensin n=1 Tax=Salmo salar TaxID=8030 RepID=A0A1S3SHQ8_SALSA|nr:extensin [Salmo salar]|eukprot:XP_014063875.1 PREDICTED: extensin-like [Salmo salar]